MLQVNSADIIVLGEDATKTNTVKLSAIEVRKGVKIELVSRSCSITAMRLAVLKQRQSEPD